MPNPDSNPDSNTEGWGAIIWATIALLLSIVALLVYFIISPPTPSTGTLYNPDPDGPVLQDIKKQMRKHGVQIVYEGWDGKLYFIRKGEKVYL